MDPNIRFQVMHMAGHSVEIERIESLGSHNSQFVSRWTDLHFLQLHRRGQVTLQELSVTVPGHEVVIYY